MARFSNPALRHRTHQIAMDGSQKLPQRLIATLADRRAADRPFDALALAVAGWVRWQSGRTDTGETFEVEDPIADRLSRATASTPCSPRSAHRSMTLRAGKSRRAYPTGTRRRQGGDHIDLIE